MTMQSDKHDLIETLSAYAHRSWSGWMEYMFGKSEHNPDGSATIPASLVQRWTRQMQTSYDGLPERERDSDREEAAKIIETISAFLKDERRALRFDIHGVCGMIRAQSRGEVYQADDPLETLKAAGLVLQTPIFSGRFVAVLLAGDCQDVTPRAVKPF